MAFPHHYNPTRGVRYESGLYGNTGLCNPAAGGSFWRSGYDVVGVYTQPDRPAGRGRSLEPPPVKTFALERGLKVLQPTSLRTPEAHGQLSDLAPDLIAIAAYGRILPDEILHVSPAGCVNVHPSLLPRHRGPSPVAFTILEGDRSAGVSIMLLDEGMDSGPVIARQEEPITPEDTTESLTDRLFRKGAKLLVESLPAYLRGDLSPQPQDDAQRHLRPQADQGGRRNPMGASGGGPVAAGAGLPPLARLLHPMGGQAAEGAGGCAAAPRGQRQPRYGDPSGQRRPGAGGSGHGRGRIGPQAGAA